MRLLSSVEEHVAKFLVVLGVFIVGLGSSVWWTALANDDPVFLDPQGSIRAELATAWIETGAPKIDLTDRANLPEDVQIALLPRDSSIVDWAVVPKDFAYPVMLNTLFTPMGPRALAAITPVGALLAAAIAARILQELTRSTIAAASAFVVLCSSVVWWSAAYGGVSYALVGVSFGLLSVLLFVRERNHEVSRPVTGYLLAAGVCVGIAAGFHYTSAPWWGAVFFVGCVGGWRAPRDLAARLGVGAVGGLVGLSPVIFFNQAVYGSPVATGYSEFATVLDAIGWSAPALGFSPSAFGANLRTYLIRPEIVPILLMASFALPAVRSLGIRVRPIHVVSVALGYVALVSITGSATLWGTNNFETNASFLRYNAPVFGLVVILAFITIHKATLSDARLRLAPVAFALVMAAINIASIGPGRSGWIDSRTGVERTVEERDLMREEIPTDAVVITRRGDKLLFGERTTLVAAYLRTFTDAAGTQVHLYDTFPEIDRLADVVTRMQPMTVVLLNDSSWLRPYQLDHLQGLLAAEGLCIDDPEELIMEVHSCSSERDSA